MVAKISHGSSLTGVLMYNQNKVDGGEATVIDSRSIIHSADYTYNVSDSEKSFECYMRANKRTEKPVIHISLNPDPRDNMDDTTAQKVAEEYLDKMGYGEQPYILYKHEDIERTHYHIVTVCVNSEGKKINDKFEKRRSMDTCRELEQKYGLHTPTKKEIFEASKIKAVDYKSGDLKKQIRNTVSGILSTYKVTSISEYKTLLELHGVAISQVDGMVDTKAVHGILYSGIDENGEKVGCPLKSSMFDKKFGYNELQKKFRRDTKLITEKNTSFMKRVITQCLYQCKDRTHKELTDLLKKRNIDLVLRINKEGRVYGVTFVDHNTKTVLNGSKLGIEFSANTLDKFFGNPLFIISEKLENKGLDSPTKENETGDVFLPINSGYDADEEAFKRKMKRKRNFKL